MATILAHHTANDTYVIVVNAAPGAGDGTPAPYGAIAQFGTGPTALLYFKEGPADTDWTPFSVPVVAPAATAVTYTPTTDADWVNPNPTTVQQALDRLAAAGGTTPVP